ncbi:MAG: hypothetical protein AB8F95_11435 [Bacteroidia bacterium]
MNQLIRTSLLFCSLLMGLVAIVPAQTVDVTKVLADPKTYTFSDNKHTVKTYIYETLEAQTTCCGPARMYLEVKIDPSGYVLNVKPLTGLDSDCYAKSVQDIVKNIKWNAKGFSAAKSIYFEIKPSIDCADGRDNAYSQVKIFNNEKIDANGVPLNYASSTGVSASAAAGTSGTPEVPAGDPATPAVEKEAVASTPATTPAETKTEKTEGGLPTPPGTKPKTDIASTSTGNPTGIPNTGESAARKEMETALSMANKERAAQDAEIQKLKDELAAQKAAADEEKNRLAQEKADAEKEAREAKIAAAEEAKRIARAERDARASADRNDRDRDRDRGRSSIDRDRGRSDRDRGSRGGGFEDRSYDRDDRYADRGDRGSEPPQREMSAVERAQAAADRAKREADELRNRMRDIERAEKDSRNSLARLQRDIVNAEKRRLEADAAVAEAREREDQNRLEEARRKAEQDKRDQERLVQEKMREMERMKSDLERAVAELERKEEELVRKQQQKEMKDAEVQSASEQRKLEIQATIDKMNLESGNAAPGTTVAGLNDPITGGGETTAQLEMLRQQIVLLTQQMQMLQNGGGTLVNRGGGTSGGNTNSSTQRTASKSSASKFKSVAANKDFAKYKKVEDLLDPNRLEEYSASTFQAVSEPLPNQGGGAVVYDEAGQPTQHVNVRGPKMITPTYAGGSTAMKQFIADELKKKSVCGLAQSVFEVTIDGQGRVLAHNILSVSNQNLLLSLPSIIANMKFEPTGSGLPVRAVYEIKADINCEGVEKVDLNSVPDLIRN